MFTLAIGRVNILGWKHLMTFTPSTRYCPVRHSPSFAIPQLSPIGTERLACLNSHPGVQLRTLAFFCTLPSSFAPSPPKPTKVLGLIKLKKKKKKKKNLLKTGLAWQDLQSMWCSKLLAEEEYDILILKVEQGLLKNWPQVCDRAYRACNVQSY